MFLLALHTKNFQFYCTTGNEFLQYLNKNVNYTKKHKNTIKGPKLKNRKQPQLYATHDLDMKHIPIKFHEDFSNGY